MKIKRRIFPATYNLPERDMMWIPGYSKLRNCLLLEQGVWIPVESEEHYQQVSKELDQRTPSSSIKEQCYQAYSGYVTVLVRTPTGKLFPMCIDQEGGKPRERFLKLLRSSNWKIIPINDHDIPLNQDSVNPAEYGDLCFSHEPVYLRSLYAQGLSRLGITFSDMWVHGRVGNNRRVTVKTYMFPSLNLIVNLHERHAPVVETRCWVWWNHIP